MPYQYKITISKRNSSWKYCQDNDVLFSFLVGDHYANWDGYAQWHSEKGESSWQYGCNWKVVINLFPGWNVWILSVELWWDIATFGIWNLVKIPNSECSPVGTYICTDSNDGCCITAVVSTV